MGQGDAFSIWVKENTCNLGQMHLKSGSLRCIYKLAQKMPLHSRSRRYNCLLAQENAFAVWLKEMCSAVIANYGIDSHWDTVLSFSQFKTKKTFYGKMKHLHKGLRQKV